MIDARCIKYLPLLLLEGSLLLGLRGSNPFFIAGLSLVAVLGLHSKGDLRAYAPLLSRRFFWLLFGIFGFSSLTLIAVDYLAIHYNTFDTGIYANLLSNFVRSGSWYSSIHQKHGFANHFTPSLVLLSPLYFISSTFIWLPILKLLSFLISPFILYKIGKEVLGEDNLLVHLAPILWIFNRYLARALEFEFQPSSLALPFILLSFYAAIKKHYGVMLLSALVAAGCKEHLALIWISLGAFLFFFQNEKKLGSSLALVGIFSGILIYFYIMPAFDINSALSHIERFGPLNLPLKKIELLLSGLLSVGTIPLLCPQTLLFIIPTYGLSLLSKDPNMLGYSFHYQDMALTVMFVGVIYGLRSLQDKTSWIVRFSKTKLHIILFLSFLITIGYNNHYPMRALRQHWPTKDTLALIKEIHMLKNELPDGDNLWVLDSLGPYFSNYQKLQSIIDIEKALRDSDKHIIILADNINIWPLSASSYQKLVQSLKSSPKYEELDDFTNLHAFSPTSQIQQPKLELRRANPS